MAISEKTLGQEVPEQRTMKAVQKSTFPSLSSPLTGENGSCAPDQTRSKMFNSNPRKSSAVAKKVWIDLDNSPHVPFFLPIISRLEQSGYEVALTARDSYQVCELLDFYNVKAKVIGKHYGKHKLLKVSGTVLRALQLIQFVRREKPDISVSHGSRGCVIASSLMGVPSVVLGDYEFTNKVKILGPKWMIFPEMVPNDTIAGSGITVLKYPGIKEDVYVSNLHPDRKLRHRVGVKDSDLLITVRPPATEAHYHNPESEGLLVEALRRFSGQPETKILLLPRNKRQEVELREAWAKEINAGNILIPSHVEDGLNLIWNSDLVISGGGTMNREAAALGVPVYSIFRGKTGAVDRYLVDAGRLTMLESIDDIHTKLVPIRRNTTVDFHAEVRPALETIMGYVEAILESRDPVTAAKVKQGVASAV